MEGGTSSMNGASWAVLIIVIILAVLLSTICSWFSALVQTVGSSLAWLIVSVIIAVLVIALLVLLCTNPDAFDRIVDLACSTLGKIGSAVNGIVLDAANGTLNLLSKNLAPLVKIGVAALAVYCGVRYVNKKSINERRIEYRAKG